MAASPPFSAGLAKSWYSRRPGALLVRDCAPDHPTLNSKPRIQHETQLMGASGDIRVLVEGFGHSWFMAERGGGCC